MATQDTRMATGTVEGTGATISIGLSAGLEFTPRKVLVLNVDGLAKLTWCHPMPPASGVKEVTDGTTSYITTLGITPVEQSRLDSGASPGRGFQIGADTDVNVSAETIFWVAWE